MYGCYESTHGFNVLIYTATATGNESVRCAVWGWVDCSMCQYVAGGPGGSRSGMMDMGALQTSSREWSRVWCGIESEVGVEGGE